MTNDPLIDEIRQIRHEISAEFNHSTQKMYAYYQQVEKELRASGQYSFWEDNIGFFNKQSKHNLSRT